MRLKYIFPQLILHSDPADIFLEAKSSLTDGLIDRSIQLHLNKKSKEKKKRNKIKERMGGKRERRNK